MENKSGTDNGYISDYLTHWTGRNGDDAGANTLSIIASTLRLLLSYNDLHIFDCSHKICERMVCFTDVPICHSAQHCARYGRFGIGFNKLKLMNVGAQPVFYASHACKRDISTIFGFLQEQIQCTTLNIEVFRALHRHFYFIQRLSDGHADSRESFYYEREWRLGEQTLVPEAKLQRPNAKYHAQQEGYPQYTGRLVEEKGKIYFSFNKEDVAFLIVPRGYQTQIINPYGFSIQIYENLIEIS